MALQGHQGQLVTSWPWVFFPKIGVFTPKMDGENNGKPNVQMDGLYGCLQK